METTPAALVLFAHGARDAAWARPLQQLKARLAHATPHVRVEIAYLELQAPTLAQVFDALAAAGVRAVAVAPVFWSSGTHVERDLPALIEAARARHPGMRVDTLPVLAELPGMIDFVAQALRAALHHAG
jgi:sirohydrochlorin cobaltochelatase